MVTKSELLGRKQTDATKKKISKKMTGRGNSQYKDGGRLEPRKLKGLKKGDKRVVDHKDGDRRNNKKSNLRIMSRSNHEKRHLRHKNTEGSGGRKPARRHALRK